MRKIDTSPISPSNGFPVKSGTLVHLQLAYQEAISEAVKGIVGSGYDTTKGYILAGLVNTGSGSNYIISAGAIFFNGEVYLVDAATFSISGSNVAVGSIVTSFYSSATSDPVQFQDGVNRNVHQIRKIVFAAGLAGSGAVDYEDLRKAHSSQVPLSGCIFYSPASGTLAEFNGAGIGIKFNTMGYALCDGQGGRPDMRGMFAVGYKSGDADFGTINGSGGSKTVTIAKTNLPNVTLGITDSVGVALAQGGETPGVSRTDVVRNDVDNSRGALGFKTAPLGDGTPLKALVPFYIGVWIQRIY